MNRRNFLRKAGAAAVAAPAIVALGLELPDSEPEVGEETIILNSVVIPELEASPIFDAVGLDPRDMSFTVDQHRFTSVVYPNGDEWLESMEAGMFNGKAFTVGDRLRREDA